MEGLHGENPHVCRAKLDASGRIVVPATWRERHGLQKGDTILVAEDEQGVRLQTVDQAIKAAQALFRAAVPQERLLSEELIQERRADAALE